MINSDNADNTRAILDHFSRILNYIDDQKLMNFTWLTTAVKEIIVISRAFYFHWCLVNKRTHSIHSDHEHLNLIMILYTTALIGSKMK